MPLASSANLAARRQEPVPLAPTSATPAAVPSAAASSQHIYSSTAASAPVHSPAKAPGDARSTDPPTPHTAVGLEILSELQQLRATVARGQPTAAAATALQPTAATQPKQSTAGYGSNWQPPRAPATVGGARAASVSRYAAAISRPQNVVPQSQSQNQETDTRRGRSVSAYGRGRSSSATRAPSQHQYQQLPTSNYSHPTASAAQQHRPQPPPVPVPVSTHYHPGYAYVPGGYAPVSGSTAAAGAGAGSDFGGAQQHQHQHHHQMYRAVYSGSGAGAGAGSQSDGLRRELRHMTEAYAQLLKEHRSLKSTSEADNKAKSEEIQKLKASIVGYDRSRRDLNELQSKCREFKAEAENCRAEAKCAREELDEAERQKHNAERRAIESNEQNKILQQRLKDSQQSVIDGDSSKAQAVSLSQRVNDAEERCRGLLREREALLDVTQEMQVSEYMCLCLTQAMQAWAHLVNLFVPFVSQPFSVGLSRTCRSVDHLSLLPVRRHLQSKIATLSRDLALCSASSSTAERDRGAVKVSDIPTWLSAPRAGKRHCTLCDDCRCCAETE